MAVNLPTNMLRSFVAIVDSGSMLNATERVFVTQSALSLQIKRLEELVQQPLFVREGRRLVLTLAGDLLLGYARRVLALHDEAVAAVSAGAFAGPVRIGMVQDFADALLTGLLARFAALHPDAQIYARVAGTAELQEMLDRSQLDLAIGYAAAGDPRGVRDAPTNWFGQEALLDQREFPLVVLEKPCRFREAATSALDAAGRPWRIAVETPNLSTLRAAVTAGLGITSRTALFLREVPLLDHPALPPLPDVSCIVLRAETGSDAPRRLGDLASELIGSL